jgi:hypothetical protein
MLSAGTHTIEDTIIDGGAHGGPSTPRSVGCLNIGSAMVTLRNVTLARCTQTSNSLPASLRVASSATLVGTFVTVITPCGLPATTNPAIGHESGSGALALRQLRVVAEDGCSLPSTSQLFASSSSIATCAELSAMSGAGCGVETACTDEALFPSDPSVTTAMCSCIPGAFTRDTSTASASFLPYSSGCFTQRVAGSVSVRGVTASSVIFRLSKSATSDESMVQVRGMPCRTAIELRPILTLSPSVLRCTAPRHRNGGIRHRDGRQLGDWLGPVMAARAATDWKPQSV